MSLKNLIIIFTLFVALAFNAKHSISAEAETKPEQPPVAKTDTDAVKSEDSKKEETATTTETTEEKAQEEKTTEEKVKEENPTDKDKKPEEQKPQETKSEIPNNLPDYRLSDEELAKLTPEQKAIYLEYIKQRDESILQSGDNSKLIDKDGKLIPLEKDQIEKLPEAQKKFYLETKRKEDYKTTGIYNTEQKIRNDFITNQTTQKSEAIKSSTDTYQKSINDSKQRVFQDDFNKRQESIIKQRQR